MQMSFDLTTKKQHFSKEHTWCRSRNQSNDGNKLSKEQHNYIVKGTHSYVWYSFIWQNRAFKLKTTLEISFRPKIPFSVISFVRTKMTANSGTC